jgi:hypothetical protein
LTDRSVKNFRGREKEEIIYLVIMGSDLFSALINNSDPVSRPRSLAVGFRLQITAIFSIVILA